MTAWLGKMWPLRAALWLLAALLCLLFWPMLATEIAPRSWLPSYANWELDGHTEFANPFLSKIGDYTIEAWDWKSGKRWHFTPQPQVGNPFITVIKDGRAYAVVTSDRFAVYVTDVTPPHVQRKYVLPSVEDYKVLVAVDPDLKFAVALIGQKNRLVVIDLAKQEQVSKESNAHEVFLVGNGELETINYGSRSSVTSPPVPKSTRWEIASDGRLVESKTPPVVNKDLLEKLRVEPAHLTSPDGRFDVTYVDRTRVDVRDRTTGQLLDKIRVPPNPTLNNVAFSTDSKHLLAGDDDAHFKIYNLETQSLVADDHRVERRWWASFGLTAASAAGCLLALFLSLRTPSFERAAWDYLLATLFWDSFATVMTTNYEWFPRGFTGLGTAAAIGIYWTFGAQSFWSRILCGAAALAIAACSYLMVVTRSPYHLAAEQSAVLASLVVTTAFCTLAAWLITLPGRWRVSPKEAIETSPRFQFGLSAVIFVVTMTGLILGMVRGSASQQFERADAGMMVMITIVLAAFFLLATAVVWVFLWLWFRQFDFLSVVLLFVIAAAAVTPALLQVSSMPQPGGFPASLVVQAFLFYAVPVVLTIAQLSFPLWLARRHGYRWVKANKPAPARIGPA